MSIITRPLHPYRVTVGRQRDELVRYFQDIEQAEHFLGVTLINPLNRQATVHVQPDINDRWVLLHVVKKPETKAATPD